MITAHLFTQENTTAPIYSARTDMPTIKFTTEAQLVNLFEGIFDRNISKNSTGLLAEFECGDGIADIVLYELRKGWKNALVLGELPPRWVYALHKLPYRRNFTTDDFVLRTSVTRNTALQILDSYTKLGFCERKNKTDTWLKTKQPRQLVNQIYAVEAKLRHWKKALTQAVRYRDYATQSWVLLDKHSIKPAVENIEQFKRLNIGLAAIATSGDISTYLTPKPLAPKSDLRFWQANAEIARNLFLRL